MKVRSNIDSHANIHSNHQSEWFDTVKDLGLAEGEWEKLTDDEKYGHAKDWVYSNGYCEIWYEEQACS